VSLQQRVVGSFFVLVNGGHGEKCLISEDKITIICYNKNDPDI